LLTALSEPEQSKALLDEPAFRHNTSNLARSVRAGVLVNYAMFTGKADDAEAAVVAAERLQDALPENPVALKNTVMAYLELASAHEAAGRLDLRDRAFEKAGAAAEALKAFPKSAVACLARYCYFERRDRLDEAEVVCEQAGRAAEGFQFDLFLAAILYRKGELERAREVLEGVKGKGSFPATALCYVLTDLGRPEKVDAILEAGDREIPTSIGRLYLYTAADFSGRRDEVVRRFKPLRSEQMADRQQGWYKHLLAYALGQLQEGSLLHLANSKGSACEAHFFIAMRHLGKGERDVAKAHFEKSAATDLILYNDYQWSRAFLARIGKAEKSGEDWPRWIKRKK
jgi:hypothetical protein